MNHTSKRTELPVLTSDLLLKSGVLIDNLFALLWQQVGMKTLLNRAGFNKRSGTPIHEVIYTLSLWLWLKKESIGMFARDCLQNMGKDVLYDTLNREDLNWRKLHELIASKAVSNFKGGAKRAFVVDDSVIQRFGKKMPGISSHFDHTSGRHVMGQQVLTLGLSCEEGFVPLDNELFTSQTKAQPLSEPFKDGRSTTAKRFRVAEQQTKPEMVGNMIRRSLRAGIMANYLLADAWFGSKAMLRLCQETDLTAIVRMKKSKLKYRVKHYRNGKTVYCEMDVKTLYQHNVRKQWQKIPGQKYRAKVVDVEINLAETRKSEAKWIKVRLLFVRGSAELSEAQVGKHEWATFLCTDTSLNASSILEIYAMRWAIEVYFKEAKQHLGLLKEQSNHYAAYIASIHLAAIRFCLLVMAKQMQGCENITQIRKQLCSNSADICYAARLWEVFRAIITGALDSLKAIIGDNVNLLLETIEQHIECFFVQALQLDSKTLSLEAQ
jgi:SRSO17 transposase